jgi:hypothetical protein
MVIGLGMMTVAGCASVSEWLDRCIESLDRCIESLHDRCDESLHDRCDEGMDRCEERSDHR